MESSVYTCCYHVIKQLTEMKLITLNNNNNNNTTNTCSCNVVDSLSIHVDNDNAFSQIRK